MSPRRSEGSRPAGAVSAFGPVRQDAADRTCDPAASGERSASPRARGCRDRYRRYPRLSLQSPRRHRPGIPGSRRGRAPGAHSGTRGFGRSSQRPEGEGCGQGSKAAPGRTPLRHPVRLPGTGDAMGKLVLAGDLRRGCCRRGRGVAACGRQGAVRYGRECPIRPDGAAVAAPCRLGISHAAGARPLILRACRC